MTQTRTAILALGLAVFALESARAQSYPSKPVRLIVPFAAGGPVDVMGRLVAQWLSSTLGQQVVVDKRPGASGAIGTRAAAAAEPDGHTLRIGSVTTLEIGPFGSKNAGYDPLKDLVPVAILGGQVDMTFEPTSVLVAHIHDAKVRPLAVTAAVSSPQLPDVPTMIESGLAGFTSYCGAGSWRRRYLAGDRG